jgi:hypothetical protein
MRQRFLFSYPFVYIICRMNNLFYTSNMYTGIMTKRHIVLTIRLLLLCLVLLLFQNQALAQNEQDIVQIRSWIKQLKENPRGPFEKIQWFCNDGSVLPPAEGACRPHGGGKQYGLWNSRTLALRQQGYLLANILAATNPDNFIGPDARLGELRQILLEQFLISVNDGWLFRQARFYRGALQNEDEQHAAREIVLALLSDPEWLTPERFLLLRETVRLLPISVEPLVWANIRQWATDISEKDPGFNDLRFKIHSLPDAQDPVRVRLYASRSKLDGLQKDYEQLAAGLESLYAPQTIVGQLQQLAEESRNKKFKQDMTDTARALSKAKNAAEAIAIAAFKTQQWRKVLLNINTYTVYNRLRLLRASLMLEREVYALGNQLIEENGGASRSMRLGWLRHLGAALHAIGMLSDRQWQTTLAELDKLSARGSLSVVQYHASLRHLARMPQWTQRSLEFHFGTTVERWLALTPLAQNFVPDRLRGSPLLAFTRVLDTLIADANRLNGIRHRIFGQEISAGLRALNPGLSRGVLLLPPEHGQWRLDGIYILKSTEQELPPVAGIITLGEGSSLSHVQLLARNMGIPNLVIDEKLMPVFSAHVDEPAVMAVSQRGVVFIESDSPKWDMVFSQESNADRSNIEADLSKLSLQDMALKPLHSIRATDSGRSVGPKAANLGELWHYYPQMVNPGLVIPFGVFREYLDKPISDGYPSVFKWMQLEYTRLHDIMDADEKSRQTQAFLAQLRKWIVNIDLGDEFRWRLRVALASTFGTEGDYGVFVRSDTNVEDLTGFSGAGLNLTVPNVVGFEAIVSAILRVWASPFSDRAFAWRQSHMSKPEHVYPAVLLMKSFASEKSGVLVTADVDNGDRRWLSIAANEGLGGAVEGQSAEELRVARSDGSVRLLAQASSAQKAVLGIDGGVMKLPASGHEQLLTANEIEQLRSLADDVEKRFPLPRNSEKLPVVTDIEFGFRQGQLALFQIRPFVESQRAWRSQTLLSMDRQLPDNSQARVDLNQPPLTGNRKP